MYQQTKVPTAKVVIHAPSTGSGQNRKRSLERQNKYNECTVQRGFIRL